MLYFRTTGNVQNDGVSMCDTSIIVDESFEEECSSQKEDTTIGHKENAIQEKNKDKTRMTNLLHLMKNTPANL